MTSFAGAFGDDGRERFAKDNLVIGAVIQTFVNDTNPPKEKRLIIVGESWDHVSVATIYINSALNIRVFPTPELQALNPGFKAEGRAYLDHDSHVDCSALHPLKKELLLSILKSNPARALGNVSEDDMQLIKKLIRSAKTITPALKKTYGLFL